MLNISLLVVEDNDPERIYGQVYSELEQWLFARKSIINLKKPALDMDRWVTNLAEWPDRIARAIKTNDLVFCTVDLAIPENSGESPEARHGLSLVYEILNRYRDQARCCIFTGLKKADLDKQLGEEIPEVLFEFKDDIKTGSHNIANYVKSQVLPKLHEFQFPDQTGENRFVLLDEQSGKVRDNYLSKAPYYVDLSTWHVPTLIIGGQGFGRQTFLEFVAYLADAEVEVVDLCTDDLDVNRQNFRRLKELHAQIENSQASKFPKRILYLDNLDRYHPEQCAEEGESCLLPLRKIIASLRELGSRIPDRFLDGFPLAIAFSVSGESRFKIRSSRTRAFVRLLEEAIGEMTDFPLSHLEMDLNGWTVDHPRIVRFPSLSECGRHFLPRVIEIYLKSLSPSLVDRLPDYTDQTVSVSLDVLDFLADKTDWRQHGNLGGLIAVLDSAFESFITNRSTGQFEITQAHLDADVYRRYMKTVLNMDDVQLTFPNNEGGRLTVVEHVDFHVEKGELLVVLGPSGSGKSTILRMLAGLIAPTSGRVTYQGEPIKGPSAKIGFMFQDYALFPWLTVRKNLEFGPRIRGVKREIYWSNVERLLAIAGLEDFKNVYPHQLSGGMRQRAAMMQSLANDPDALLMDEPFGALDVQTRWDMQDFLIKTKIDTGTTIVFVTHDIDEAVYVGDRIYVATARPLTLAEEFIVPFSSQARKQNLRRDPSFVAYTNRVRESLLNAAAAHQPPAG